MENFNTNDYEILKVVRRHGNYNSYRPVFDKTLVDDIKYYSWWGGQSNFLFNIFGALNSIPSNNNVLLALITNKNNVSPKTEWSNRSAGIINGELYLKEWDNLLLRMPKDNFLEFYQNYLKLVEHKAHEIILKLENGKLSAQGLWYENNSPFNLGPAIFIADYGIWSCTNVWNPDFPSKYRQTLIDRDWLFRSPFYTVYSLFAAGDFYTNIRIPEEYYYVEYDKNKTDDYCMIAAGSRGIRAFYYQSLEFTTAYYKYIKDNVDQFIGEIVFRSSIANAYIKSSDMIVIKNDFDEDLGYEQALCQINLDDFFYMYIEINEIEKRHPDEIRITKYRNGPLKIEGINYNY